MTKYIFMICLALTGCPGRQPPCVKCSAICPKIEPCPACQGYVEIGNPPEFEDEMRRERQQQAPAEQKPDPVGEFVRDVAVEATAEFLLDSIF